MNRREKAWRRQSGSRIPRNTIRHFLPAFILHPSSFRLNPSALILSTKTPYALCLMFNSTCSMIRSLFDACASFDGGVVMQHGAPISSPPNQLARPHQRRHHRDGPDHHPARHAAARHRRGHRRQRVAHPRVGLLRRTRRVPRRGRRAAWRLDTNANIIGNWTPLVSTVDGTMPGARSAAARVRWRSRRARTGFFSPTARVPSTRWDGTRLPGPRRAQRRRRTCAHPSAGCSRGTRRGCASRGRRTGRTRSSFSDPLLAPRVLGDNAANTVRVGRRRRGRRDRGARAVERLQSRRVETPRRVGRQHGGRGSGAVRFPVNAIHHRIGCAAARTAVQVGSDVWFLSADGVRSVQRTRATMQQEVGDTLSLPIHDLIERINPAAVGTSCAVCWANRYLLAVPLDGASAPNAVLVCDTLTQTWTGQWLGWRPLDWVVSGLRGRSAAVLSGKWTGP